uniref:F-box associated domain-containing protein n=1 Tax=Leersia perrieri TaxID=77586 RepID=A0A0D9XUE8_9ORYZ
MDHCDGLLLCTFEWGRRFCVHNPATRRWTTLPLPPPPQASPAMYLVFDPAVSPHYEVFSIPDLPEKPKPPVKPKPMEPPFCGLDELLASLDGAEETWEIEEFIKEELPPPPPSPSDDEIYWKMEWPPSPYRVEVFSSRSGRWEKREFVREEEAETTTVDDMKPWKYFFVGPRQGYGVFFQGALYVHSGGDSVTRFSLSNDKYQVIRTPINIPDRKNERPYLGKSTMGVSLGFIHDCQISIWMLKESAGQMEWVLNYKHDLHAVANQVYGPWILEEDNIHIRENKDHGWDSENDDFLDSEVGDEGHYFPCLGILGFHPYKEIIFLQETFRTAAYHLDCKKVQYLGYSRPKCYYQNHTNGIYESFIYTPCVHGVIINYVEHYRPHLFSRPQSPAATTGGGEIKIDGNLSSVMDIQDKDYMDYWYTARRPQPLRWAMLPEYSAEDIGDDGYASVYLAFDPAVSPAHYEVLLIPFLMIKLEWPPSPYKVEVFSSRTGRWEEREFVREEEGEAAATTVDDMKMKPWDSFIGPRRVLEGSIVCPLWRFSLSSNKYQVIRTSITIPDNKYEKLYLGKSKMGLSLGFIHKWKLSVWILRESAGQMEWILYYQHDLRAVANQVVASIKILGEQINRPWILEEDDVDMGENKDHEWDSDNDDFLAIQVVDKGHDFAYFDILGFHPYKEIIFLELSFITVAYHLDSSKVQYLGNSRPKCYYQSYSNGVVRPSDAVVHNTARRTQEIYTGVTE